MTSCCNLRPLRTLNACCIVVKNSHG